jgi:hypothetical protein
MTAWMDLVKKLSKENPGKPLGAILPLAKKIYRKSKNAIGPVITQKKRKGHKTGNRFVRKTARRIF